MNTYLDYRALRAFEDLQGYKNIVNKNRFIGEKLKFTPEVEWMVGDENGSCFHPKSIGCNDAPSQKREAERWLKEQQERFPNGWVIKEGNRVVKREYYPYFHSDWNDLIEAVKILKLNGVAIEIDVYNIFNTWSLVHDGCKQLK